MKHYLTYFLLLILGTLVSFDLARQRVDVSDSLQAGIEVYLGEGCIHCHSQYRRPVNPDKELWGAPSDPAAEMERQKPVLFGNRRQGPDLSNVGLRRSRDWNRLHLMNPQSIRKNSRMPDYRYLFDEQSQRGERLLDYLQSLGFDDMESWNDFVGSWTPEKSFPVGNADAGEALYQQYCIGCHGATGDGSGDLANRLNPAPRNLRLPQEWIWTKGDTDSEFTIELARTIKFGRMGTSMAGTEWLDEQELADLIRYLQTLR